MAFIDKDLERDRGLLEEAYGEQFKLRFAWLNNDVEGHSDHVAALCGDREKFKSGLRDLKAMRVAALKIIDEINGEILPS